MISYNVENILFTEVGDLIDLSVKLELESFVLLYKNSIVCFNKLIDRVLRKRD